MTIATADEELTGRYKVVWDFLAERDRQDAKWGSQRRLSNLFWNAILGEEVGEAAKEVLEQDDAKLRAELVQVGAVVMAWIQALDDGRQE